MSAYYLIHLVQLVLIFGLATLGLSICAGHSGQLSMAQAASFGIGAYTYSVVSLSSGLMAWQAIALAFLLSITFAVIPAYIAFKLSGDEFTFGTLALSIFIAGIVANSTDGTSPLGTLSNLTNGPYGISDVPALPGILPDLEPWSSAAETAVAIALLATMLFFAIGSRWGLLLRAIKDSPELALSLGKSIYLERAAAAFLASILGSISGAFYAAHVRYVDPSIASTDLSVFFLTCLLIGGATNFFGAWLGTAAVVLLPESLRLLGVGGPTVASLRVIGYSTALLLLIHLRPLGLMSRRES